MNKKVRSFIGLVSIAIGGGLVYVSSNDYFSASADTLNPDRANTTLIVLLFIIGIALIAIGVMVSLFLFATSQEDK